MAASRVIEQRRSANYALLYARLELSRSTCRSAAWADRRASARSMKPGATSTTSTRASRPSPGSAPVNSRTPRAKSAESSARLWAS